MRGFQDSGLNRKLKMDHLQNLKLLVRFLHSVSRFGACILNAATTQRACVRQSPAP